MKIFCTNVGALDRALRIMLGVGLLACALNLVFPGMGYNQLGWLGLIPFLTGLSGFCPVYSIAEISTAGPRRP